MNRLCCTTESSILPWNKILWKLRALNINLKEFTYLMPKKPLLRAFLKVHNRICCLNNLRRVIIQIFEWSCAITAPKHVTVASSPWNIVGKLCVWCNINNPNLSLFSTNKIPTARSSLTLRIRTIYNNLSRLNIFLAKLWIYKYLLGNFKQISLYLLSQTFPCTAKLFKSTI